MRRVLLISLLCLLAVASTGCKKALLRRQLKELMGSTIVLPEKISCVYNGEVYPMPDSLREKAMLIMYIDSTECTGCRLSKLVEYHSFAEALRDWNMEFLALVSPKQSEHEYVSDLILSYVYPFPVFLDDEGAFFLRNPQFAGKPSNLHAVLVNQEKRPVLIGDPLGSEAMSELLFKRVTTLISNKALQ